jgi:hypothetical protein
MPPDREEPAEMFGFLESQFQESRSERDNIGSGNWMDVRNQKPTSSNRQHVQALFRRNLSLQCIEAQKGRGLPVDRRGDVQEVKGA